MTRILRDGRLALSLFTFIPSRVTLMDGEHTEAASWFPAVGALFGVIGYAVVKLAGVARFETRVPLLVAAVLFALWALVSRLVHLEGLAHVADGFWGAEDPSRRLEIVADQRTGAFGSAALVLAGLLEVTAMGAILARPHELPFLIVPVLGRFSATAAAWLGRPAKPTGLGASIAGHPSSLGLVIGLVPLLGAFAVSWLGFAMTGVAVCAFGLAVAFGVPHVLSERFGGVTGDVMAASVVITEVIVLLVFAAVV